MKWPLREGRPVSVLFLLVMSLLLWGTEFVRRDLWEPDEARYAYVAREMRESGSWFVPLRHGETYAHKPPLMFWLINAGSLLTGGEIGSVATRLPSLLGSLLSLWAATRLAFLWFGSRHSLRVAFILFTSFLFWKQGGMGQIDALLCGFEMAGFYLLVLNDVRPRLSTAAGAYAAFGLAILAKGPVGLLVPLGAYVCARLAAGEGALLKKWHFAWGPLLTLLFPGAWLLGAWLQGGPAAYFRELLIDQNVGRAVGEVGEGHAQPFFYFLWHYPLEALPWAVFLPWAFSMNGSEDERRSIRRLAGWIGWVILFFSLSVTKRNLYILFAHPATAILVSNVWGRLKESRVGAAKAGAWFATGLVCLLAVACTGAALWPLLSPAIASAWPKAAEWPALPISTAAVWPSAICLLLGGVALIRELRRSGATGRWFYSLALVMFINFALVGGVVFPAVNPLKTPVALLEAAPEHLPPGSGIVLFGMKDEIYSFYLHRPTRRADNPAEVRARMKAFGRGVLVTSQRLWPEIEGVFPDDITVNRFTLGHKKMCWVPFGSVKAEK